MFGRGKPFLIIGLGNPGREFRGNRHNVGFMVLDRLAGKLETSFTKIKMEALMTAVRYKNQRLILIKPQKFMNLSGKVTAAYARFYKIPLEQILVVYDDVDLPFETLRLKPDGGDAGQKGVRSIIDELGTKEFSRLRVGIDRPPGRTPVSSYVLQDFSGQEQEWLPSVLDRATDAILTFIREPLDAALIEYNYPSNLNIHSPVEYFSTYVRVGLMCGVMLASPWVFYQLWSFVAAGLYEQEKKWVRFFGPASLVDLAPTLIALANDGQEVELAEQLDGENLLPMTIGARQRQTDVVAELKSEGLADPVIMIRRNAYKFIGGPAHPSQLFGFSCHGYPKL